MSRLPTQEIIDRYHAANETLATTTDTQEMIKLSKQQTKLEPQYQLAYNIQTTETAKQANEEMLSELEPGDELVDMTKTEIDEQAANLTQWEDELLMYLNPSDPRDDEDILLEIRAGAGGDESALFAADLFKMYASLAESRGMQVSLVSTSLNDVGGYKEVIAEIKSKREGVYSWYKYESGVHRVQRVPSTEKQGRIHTSTASVAIMPLIEPDNDFKIDPKEIEIIISTSSGKGGQSVNTTYSAVKMKHTPTGLEAQSQDERSQVQNKIKCLSVLTSRVYDHYEELRLAEEAAERREQVGRADRSEKIRTYNFPQDRLTDHRYSHSWNQLPTILTGGVESVIEDIRKFEAEKVLARLAAKDQTQK